MDAAVRWLFDLQQARAAEVVDVPGGVALRHPLYPDAYDHNQLLLVGPTTREQVLAAVAEHGVRRVELLAGDVDLAADGFDRDDFVLLVWDAAEPAPQPGVVELEPDRRYATAEREWAQELPGADPDVHRQLGQRLRTVVAAASTTFLAVRGDDGEVLARADLYVRGTTAQVEDVWTHPDHRRRGLASRVVREAVRLALEDRATTVLIHAGAGTKAADLYRRLGFVDLTTASAWLRRAA